MCRSAKVDKRPLPVFGGTWTCPVSAHPIRSGSISRAYTWTGNYPTPVLIRAPWKHPTV